MVEAPPGSLKQSFLDIYSDSRTHGYQGPSRYVRYPRVTSAGGGCIAKSEDGFRCAVAGKESLRVLRISDGSLPVSPESRSVTGKGGYRIDATRNLWEGCGLKIESSTTGMAWGRGPFSNKIFTSARNGELIMWDMSRAGSAKIERRTKDHIRSINQLSISHSVHHYCVTGSADGDLRIWDLRDMSRSLMRVYHPTSVRSVAFSPFLWQPLQAIVGLDNGSIYRWDLRMGQRGLIDRLLVAHTTPVTSLAWCNPSENGGSQTADGGLGWFASGALDRTVKVWDMTSPSRIPSKPTYILHPRYPVRHILWRPGYDCELAVVSHPEFAGAKTDVTHLRPSGVHGVDNFSQGSDNEAPSAPTVENKVSGPTASVNDAIEIWDVRRAWVAKWSVRRSGAEGNLTDVDFADPHAMWALHSSGGFSQFDLREATKPIDAVSRIALSWEVSGSVAFVSDSRHQFEVPYDDIHADGKPLAEKLGVHVKLLGDPSVQPLTQSMGTHLARRNVTELGSFTTLARKYTLTGENRKSLCVKNAQAAMEVGEEECAQLWQLLAVCLEEVVPVVPPTRSQMASPQPAYSLLPTPASARYAYFPLGAKPAETKISPGRRSTNSAENPKYPRSTSRSTSRHLTPASSASSSPRHGLVHLPPITPRRPSFPAQQRGSADRRPSTYRRPSVPPSSGLASVEKEKSNSSNLHYVALDDSDSSSGNDSDVGSPGTAGNWSDEETHTRLPLPSPTFLLQRSVTAPSPLSRVAGKQRWTDEEGTAGVIDDDDDDGSTSASPQSTDSDSNPSVSNIRRQWSGGGGKRMSDRHKSRSRSSTVASLAAPAKTGNRGGSTLRRASISSVRTVVAGDIGHGEMGVKPEGTIRDLGSRAQVEPTAPVVPEAQQDAMMDMDCFTERKMKIVQEEEKRIREGCLQVLRQALETLADSGDAQMCAMLAMIARSELLVSTTRSVAFVEAYIDKLDRLQMFSYSAYIRKHCQLKEIESSTTTHTNVYTSCGWCYKPLLKPCGRLPDGSVVKGGYAYCLTCKVYVSCSICRLPVRTLFFQCSVCKHGGHEKCHREYYDRWRLSMPANIGARYQCPTGCGHACFI